jgi:hypothetical protein
MIPGGAPSLHRARSAPSFFDWLDQAGQAFKRLSGFATMGVAPGNSAKTLVPVLVPVESPIKGSSVQINTPSFTTVEA